MSNEWSHCNVIINDIPTQIRFNYNNVYADRLLYLYDPKKIDITKNYVYNITQCVKRNITILDQKSETMKLPANARIELNRTQIYDGPTQGFCIINDKNGCDIKIPPFETGTTEQTVNMSESYSLCMGNKTAMPDDKPTCNRENYNITDIEIDGNSSWKE